MSRKVIDCFPFFNEFELLKARIWELKDVADKHVLIEADRTHTGIPKPLYFEENKGLFDEWKSKIVHKIVLLPDGANWPGTNWFRETSQRMIIHNVLDDLRLDDDDVVISADVDEIPRASVVQKYRDRVWEGLCCLKMPTYHYDLRTLLLTPTLDPKIGRYSDIRTFPGGVANMRYSHTGLPLTVIEEAGWHLSFMGGVDKVIEKVKAYAHYDVRDPRSETYASRENVESAIRDAKSLFLREDVKYTRLETLSDLPTYIRENFDHFAEIGWTAGAKLA